MARIAAARVRRIISWSEAHYWYEMRFSGGPDEGVPSPWRLEKARPDQLVLVEQLGRSELTAREFSARGHDLWLALSDDGPPAFGCWIHRTEAPMLGAPGGWLVLPDGIVCLEDSVTGESARGRGIAPAAWRSIATKLSDEGLKSMITKVAVDNAPANRAVTKSGFEQIAVMRLRRSLGRTTITVEPDPTPAVPAALALQQALQTRSAG